MLLKSSSTPVLGSLIPSFSDSPNNTNHTPNSKISCTNNNNNNNNNSFRKPIFRSPSLPETKLASAGFRRVQSEGNLEELANTGDEFSLSKNKPSKRSNFCTLDTIPSFSLRHSGTRLEDEDSDDDDDDDEFESDQFQIRNNQNLVGESNIIVNNNGLRFGGIDEAGAGKMYLAAGLGVCTYGGGGGGGGGCRPVDFDRDGGDVSMEDYYKRMLEENPGDALFLRNYAQFLYQKKRDLGRAEEYYSRAILADPNDGEILSQYAKLIWELHNDEERATYYFERAAQASSEDSHVHAAYASFLWDTEEENDAADNFTAGQQLFHHGFMASATA